MNFKKTFNTFYKLTFLIALLIQTHCVKLAEETSTTTEACKFKTDNKVYTFPTECLTDNVSHIRLDNLVLGVNSGVTIYNYATSNNSEDGLQVKFTRDNSAMGTITVQYPDTASYSLNTDLVSNANIWCMDLHTDEAPTHYLMWHGTLCNNNSNTSQSAFFESEADVMWKNNNPPQGASPSGKYFNYKAYGTVTVDKFKASNLDLFKD